MLKLCLLKQGVASSSAVCLGLICCVLSQKAVYRGTGAFSRGSSEKQFIQKRPVYKNLKENLYWNYYHRSFLLYL